MTRGLLAVPYSEAARCGWLVRALYGIVVALQWRMVRPSARKTIRLGSAHKPSSSSSCHVMRRRTMMRLGMMKETLCFVFGRRVVCVWGGLTHLGSERERVYFVAMFGLGGSLGNVLVRGDVV